MTADASPLLRTVRRNKLRIVVGNGTRSPSSRTTLHPNEHPDSGRSGGDGETGDRVAVVRGQDLVDLSECGERRQHARQLALRFPERKEQLLLHRPLWARGLLSEVAGRRYAGRKDRRHCYVHGYRRHIRVFGLPRRDAGIASRNFGFGHEDHGQRTIYRGVRVDRFQRSCGLADLDYTTATPPARTIDSSAIQIGLAVRSLLFSDQRQLTKVLLAVVGTKADSHLTAEIGHQVLPRSGWRRRLPIQSPDADQVVGRDRQSRARSIQCERLNRTHS